MSELLTKSDVESIIKDNVGPLVAKAMVDAMRESGEKGDVARAAGKSAVELARAQETPGLATVDMRTLQVLHDPHKGKGLDFARWVKVQVTAKAEGRQPAEVAGAWAKTNPAYARIADEAGKQNRAFLEGNFAQGGALVPPAMAAEFIELLYPATVALRMGANTVDFNGSLDMGRINGGATAAYVGEASNITPSQPTTGQLKLTRKKAAGLVVLTNELFRNPAVGADALVRNDLLMQMALRRDLSFFRGTGDTFQPKGITNWIAAGNKNASAGATLANKVADLIQAIRLVDESNVPLVSGGFVMSPRSKWSLFATLDAQGKFVFADMLAQGNLFGQPFATTTQIPNNLGGGSESEVYFGAFNDAIIGFDIGTPLQVEVFPNGAFFDGSALVSGISTDQTVVRAIEGHDVLLRHNNTFSMITGVAWV